MPVHKKNEESSNKFVYCALFSSPSTISHWLKKLQLLFAIYYFGKRPFSYIVNTLCWVWGSWNILTVFSFDKQWSYRMWFDEHSPLSSMQKQKKRKGKRTSSWPRGVVGREFGQFFFSYISPLAWCNLKTLHLANLLFRLSNEIFFFTTLSFDMLFCFHSCESTFYGYWRSKVFVKIFTSWGSIVEYWNIRISFLVYLLKFSSGCRIFSAVKCALH